MQRTCHLGYIRLLGRRITERRMDVRSTLSSLSIHHSAHALGTSATVPTLVGRFRGGGLPDRCVELAEASTHQLF